MTTSPSDSSFEEFNKENDNGMQTATGNEFCRAKMYVNDTVDEYDLDCNQRPSYACFDDHSYKEPQLTDSIVRKLDDEFLLMENGPEKIKTYLRIRPPSKHGLDTLAHSKLYTVEEGASVLKINGHPSLKKSNPYADETKFTFSRIFEPQCSQSTVFEECVQPILESFLSGESCLIFSYGATNSGKTFTMQGYGTQFGIIPRTLEYLFNALEDKLYTAGNIKPVYFSAFLNVSEAETKLLEGIKQRLLTTTDAKNKSEMNSFRASFSRRSSTSSFSSGSAILVDKIMNANQQPYTHYAPNTVLFAIWVSFAEIYNERVYDLFENVPRGKRRKDMKLLTDKEGRVYIKDLTEVCANNPEEAYQLFLAGKANLQRGCTKANATSSRSHSFFNIRMVSCGVHPNQIYPQKVFQISFCDLAGLERVCQTGNAGLQLKESGNINQSLFVLLKCIRAMRDKQGRTKHSTDILPFRESKLARLFQGYLTSATHTCMIVNINPEPEMIDSSLHVLQNSAIASEVITYRRVEPPSNDSKFYKRVRASISHSNQIRDNLNNTDVSNTFDEEDEDEFEGETVVAKAKVVGEPLKEKVARLETENDWLKKQLMSIEERIRNEMLAQFVVIQKEYEEDQKELMREKEMFSNNMQERRMSMAVKIWSEASKKEDKNVGTSPAQEMNVTPMRASQAFTPIAQQLNSPASKLIQENCELKNQIEDWRCACVALQSTLNERNSQIGTITVEKNEMEALHASRVEDFKHLLKLKEEEITSVKQCDPEKLKVESLHQINQLTEELKEKHGIIQGLKEELSEAMNTCIEYDGKLNEANSKITQISSDYNKLHEENKALAEENELMHLSVDDLISQNTKLKAQQFQKHPQEVRRTKRHI